MIGCTGGIGAGKSTVAAYFATKGARVVNADVLARAALAPGGRAYGAVCARFGAAVLAPDGQIDRSALAASVFADAAARRDLEALVHPVIEQETLAAIAAAPTDSVVVIDAALLVETDGRRRYGLDGLLVVDCPEELAVARLVASRAMSEPAARARLRAQAGREERLRAADYVIVNIGSLAELEAMAEAAWGWVRSLAGAELSG